MAAALVVVMPGFALLKRRGAPLFASAFAWPDRTGIDRPLVAGAALFGVGWGLVGLCPGPALVNLATLSPKVVAFVVAMAIGAGARDMLLRSGAPRPQPA